MTYSIMNKTGITGWNDVVLVLNVLLIWHMKCEVEMWYGENGNPGGNQPINVMSFSTSCYKMKGRSMKLTIIKHVSHYNNIV